MGVAAARCADRGAIVAVAEQPAPLDCAGRAAETGLADAVETLARSLARSEGPPRGAGQHGHHAGPPHTARRSSSRRRRSPPSRARSTLEVAGAVRALLGHDAVGITATTVHADCGRIGR